MKAELNTVSRRLGVGYSTFDLSAFLEEKAFVYLLRCNDNSLYCGWTSDIQKRVKAHNAGKGAKYTKSHKVKKIERVFLCENRSTACILESEIKKLTKDKKEAIIIEPDSYVKELENIRKIKILKKI